ncbi:MAG: hypothetical protein H0U53_04200 [Actinobacteria bacterium]|nr:hypothetical protein [Actinomycetota bacterium]
MSIKKFVLGAVTASLVVAGPVGAHERDVITAGGQVGPIETGMTSTADMKKIFGDPNQRKIVRVGCSRVVKLRWDDVQTYAYLADPDRKIVDVKVLSRTLHALQSDYNIHTWKGLRVGDSEARLMRLYEPDPGESHNGHTHYLLGEGRSDNRLVAKVVNSKVVQLEAAPFEYC